MIHAFLKQNKKCIFSAVQAFFITLLICCDKTVNVKEILDFKDFLKNCVGILPIIVFTSFVMFITWVGKNIVLDKPKKIGCFIVALIFAVLWLVGYSIKESDSLSYWGFFGFYSNLVYVFLSFGLVSAFYNTVKCLLYFLLKDNAIGENAGNYNLKRNFWFGVLSCSLVWVIYYVIFFPGVVTWDSYYQINQSLGFVPLTNENPFMHTLLEACFLRVAYAVTGKIEIGIAVFLLFQMFVITLIVSFANITLIQLNVKPIIRHCFMLFYIANPLVGIYSITMWKDIWMAALVMLLAVLIVRYVYFKEHSLKLYISIGFTCFGVLSAKGTGIIMVLFALIALVFTIKKHRYKIIITFLAAIVCYYGLQGLVINRFDVMPGHIRETKSMFLQQVARVVKYHGSELTDFEKETIDEVLPYDKLAELYNPGLSDPVKGGMNEKQYQSDEAKYIKLWFNLGIKYPKTYLTSILANSYGYWYPDTEYWTVSSGSYRDILKMYQDNKWTIYDPQIENYDLSEDAMARRESIGTFFETFKKLPVISFLSSIGLYFWIYVIVLLATILKKDIKIMPLIFIAIGVFLSCVLSPVFAEMRYAYPAIFMFPFVLTVFKIPNK